VITHQVTPLQHLTTPIALNFIPPFAVAALEPRRRAAIGLACCWLGILLVDGPGAFPGNAVIATVCWAAGAGLRARTGLIEQLRRNNLLLAEGRAALTARAVEEERSRLARELHDAVGHSLTVVALQAAAALRIWPTDRSRAEEMLATTRAAVVDGLRELQTSLAASSDGQGSVDQLIVQARAAGVQVTAQVDDEVAVLPPRYRQAIYRTVQEALTNAVKHSPGSAVDISVRHVDDGVTLQVYNGPAAAPRAPSPHSGHGLIGMRRRLEQLGGSLSHEQRPDGGFRLRAQLPCRSGST
jgi:signal transduction histidine kinase